MAQDPLINCQVTITAIDINGNSVLSVFTGVLELRFDYFYGKLFLKTPFGSPSFNLNKVAALTYTVNGTVTTVEIT
jgi:hypothetical protein